MAEGRLPQRLLHAEREHLAAAVPLQVQAANWAGAVDRSEPLSAAFLAAKLLGEGVKAGTVVAVSHDDYATNSGGIQNIIGDEQRALIEAGWWYLHISPAAPLPMLANHGDDNDYRLRLRLNGQALGVVRFPDLASVLAKLREKGTDLKFTVVSRRHFFSMAPDWRHVRATMMVDLADLRGFVGERR
jgi:hypothetical protein